MTKSKAQKRKDRKKRRAMEAAMVAPMTGRHAVVTRGRPPERREIGPTPETAAKLKPDTLAMLRALKIDGEPFLSADLVEAGEQILRTWGAITAAVDCRSNVASYGGDSDSDRLQLTWRRWCAEDANKRPFNELFRRCLVRPSVVVDWLKDSDRCDRDPKGAAGVLKRALEWWRLAARDVGRAER